MQKFWTRASDMAGAPLSRGGGFFSVGAAGSYVQCRSCWRSIDILDTCWTSGASFSSVIGSLVPRAVSALIGKHPGLQIDLTSAQPPEALEMLRTRKIDVAVMFRYPDR